MLGLLQETTGEHAAVWLARSPFEVGLALESIRAYNEVKARAMGTDERSQGDRDFQAYMRGGR